MRSRRSWALDRMFKATQTLLATMLISSVIFAVWVAATDGWLRAVAPTHEYGLLAFAILDVLLTLIVFVAPRIADVGALAVAVFQVGAMLSDAFTFSPAGTIQAAFRAYLLSDFGFVALLVTQVALASVTTIGVVLLYESGHRVHAAHPSKLRLT